MRLPPKWLLLAVPLLACGGDDDEGPPVDALCAGVQGACTALPAGTSEAQVQRAFVEAQPGATLVFGEGTFAFTNTLSLEGVDGVTVRGAGREKTVLDFTGQAAGSEGLYVSTSDDFTVKDLGVRNPKGDGIKVLGADGVRFEGVRVEWTGANATEHGAYGLYPVQSKRVLIQDSYVRGASDSGIYVGQSQDIVVRRNEAVGNVSGIEIENSHRADVYENHVHGNTGGLLIFTLPGLQQPDGKLVRAFDNRIEDNNLANFAPAGNIVATVPAGTGVIVMANTDVELFGNTIARNDTVGAAVISFLLVSEEGADAPGFYPFSARVALHDNTFTANGQVPDATKELGLALHFLREGFPGQRIPDIVFDGLVDPTQSTPPANPMQVCIGSHASWANLHADHRDSNGLFNAVTTDVAGYDCTRPALPAVSFQGL